MTKEELELKISVIEKSIEWNKEIRDFDKKSNKSLIFINIFVFIAILILSVINKDKNVSILDVFSISLYIVSTYNMFNKMNEYKRDNEQELRCLNIDLDYYKTLLDKVEK